MKLMKLAMALGALLLLGACSGTAYLDHTQSDCKGSPSVFRQTAALGSAEADGDEAEAAEAAESEGDTEDPKAQSFALHVEGHDVIVIHNNAVYDCGYAVRFTLKRSRQTLIVYEEDYNPHPGIESACLGCLYDLSATIHDVAAGMYTVELRRAKSGALLFSAQVTIGA